MSSWLDESLDVPVAALGQPVPSFVSRLRSAPDEDEDMVDVALVTANRRGPELPSMEFEAGEETKLQELIRHWMNERHAPDILPAQSTLLGRLLDHIRKQSETVQLLRADPDSSEEEHFRIMLAQTEIERVKFIVRSYVRTRLYKIEKYARFIVANSEIQEKLSETELQHARKFAHLVESHFNKTVLQSLPPEQRGLADNIAFMPPMIPEPDKTRAVFAMARTQCPPVRLPDGSTSEMEKGQISLTQYYVVEQLLARGEVELV